MRHSDCDELNVYSSDIYTLPKMSRRDEWKRVFTFSHSKQGAFALKTTMLAKQESAKHEWFIRLALYMSDDGKPDHALYKLLDEQSLE